LYLIDSETATFIATLAKHYSVSTLVRLAEGGEVLSRRASVLGLGFLGSVSEADCIGERLSDSDRRVRLVAEDSMKAIWSRQGSPRQRQRMSELCRLLQDARYQETVDAATQIIADYPDVPDAFCQRGLARLYLSEPEDAIVDCRAALSINPYHYTAAIGIGHCFLDQNDPARALDWFRTAIGIYPDVEQVNIQINRLEKALREQN
jgi:tetratricopeptide (TPR) repeat protein